MFGKNFFKIVFLLMVVILFAGCAGGEGNDVGSVNPDPAPTATTEKPVAPINFSWASYYREGIKVTWEMLDPNHCGQYRIERTQQDTGEIKSVVFRTAEDFYIDVDVEKGKTYSYVLYALSEEGLESDPTASGLTVTYE